MRVLNSIKHPWITGEEIANSSVTKNWKILSRPEIKTPVAALHIKLRNRYSKTVDSHI